MAVIEENNKNVIFSSCYFSQGIYFDILILVLSSLEYLNTKERVSHWNVSKQNVLFNYVEIDQNYITDSSWSGEKKNDKIKPW